MPECISSRWRRSWLHSSLSLFLGHSPCDCCSNLLRQQLLLLPTAQVLLSFCEIWHTFKNPPIAINNASQPSLYILSVLHHISFMLCYIINSYITSDDYITELAFSHNSLPIGSQRLLHQITSFPSDPQTLGVKNSMAVHTTNEFGSAIPRVHSSKSTLLVTGKLSLTLTYLITLHGSTTMCLNLNVAGAKYKLIQNEKITDFQNCRPRNRGLIPTIYVHQ